MNIREFARLAGVDPGACLDLLLSARCAVSSGIYSELTREDRTRLLAAMDRLPARGREVVTPEPLWTTADAAREARVQQSTIRKWVSRGVLTPQRKDEKGRNLFRPHDVGMASDRVRRSRKPVTSASGEYGSRDLNRLLTTKDAAILLNVSESTIRTWVHRGLIQPALPGPRPKYKFGSFVELLNRDRRPNRYRRWIPSDDYYALLRATEK